MAVKHSDLVDSVIRHAAIAGTQEATERAREITDVVLRTLARSLPDRQRRVLAEKLPGPLTEATLPAEPCERRSSDELLGQVAAGLNVSNEQARYLAQAVLAGLDETDSSVLEQLREHLASDLLDVLTPVGESTERATSERGEVPTELSEEGIAQALRGLTGWVRDGVGISRTVNLPADRVRPLVNRVQREAGRLNDHARTDITDDGVTFTLSTGRHGVVTEPDVTLAERIDNAVFDVGSGGRPG